MAATDFFVPRSVDEAIALLGAHGPDLVVLGGGTIVMGLVNDGLLFPRRVMSLARAGMDGIEHRNGHVKIGAAATMATLGNLEAEPLLAETARAIGAPAVRTTATAGGNLFAAPPYGDLGVALLALDTRVELAGPNGRRTLALDEFFAARVRGTLPGGELVASLEVPRSNGHTSYLKQMRRQANSPAVVAVAVRLLTGANGVCTEARIALGAAGPHPSRAHNAEAALVGHVLDASALASAAEAARDECDPFTDALASAWYRRRMVGVQVRRALERALPAA